MTYGRDGTRGEDTGGRSEGFGPQRAPSTLPLTIAYLTNELCDDGPRHRRRILGS